MGFFESINPMPTYADGRGDPCGIGSGTSDKELFHKKRGCCISHLSARCARHFPRKRGKLIYSYPKPSPLSRGRGTAQAVEGAQRRGCCTKFATSCNSPFLILSAAPAEAGGSPLCRTPAGDGESEHIFRGAKACFGVGESACGRGIDAAYVCGRMVYGAVCSRTLR